MRRILTLTATLAAVLAVPAHAASFADGRDAGTSRLDIKSVAAGIVGDRARFTLMTHRSWASSFLSATGANRYVCFYLWRAGKQALPGKQDIQVCASYSGGRLTARAFDVASRTATRVTVRRRRTTGIQFEVPTALVGGDHLNWLGASKDGRTGKGFDIAPRSPRRMDFAP